MKLIKIYAVCWIICSAGCADKPEKTQPKTDSISFIYPGVIDSLNLRSFFDSARWAVYTWNCDILYRQRVDSNSKISKSFGLLSLKFDTLVVKDDTLDFYFRYFDNLKPIFAFDLDPYVFFKRAVGFNKKTGEKLYMIGSENYLVKEVGRFSRFENPLQFDVIRYIDSNWNKLDPCFRNFAEQRGLNSHYSKTNN